MFLKAFKVKSNHQLKTSDRKLLKDDFKKHFPSLSEDDLNAIFPKRDVVSLVKIEVQGSTIVNAYLVRKIPVAFVCDGNLFPTVFLLWKYPNILVSFTTYSAVFSKLVVGADLMLPGVVYPTVQDNVEFRVNEPAYINVTDNVAALAVGVTVFGSRDIAALRNHGKCVIIYHVYGDKLCSIEAPEYPSVPELGVPEFMKIITLEVNKENEATCDIVKDERCINNLEDLASASTVLTTKEADDLLSHCFLSTLKNTKNITLPILASTFYKVHILPKCPENKPLDIKKTSYKKFGSFLESMMQLGLLKIDEPKKGVVNITEFDYKHPQVYEFVQNPIYTRIETENDDVEENETSIIESHSVTASVAPIFAEFGYGKGSIIENANVRKLVTEYVKNHKLQSEQNKSHVNLNDTLRKVGIREYPITYPVLINQIYQAMTPCYKITCGGKEVIRRGKLEVVSISVAKRSGNKKITLVDNVEIFGINVEELATCCQRGVAASTTINRSQTQKKTDQLQIQGNQVLFVYNLLIEKYKLPKRYIKGLEFAPKKRN